MKVLSFVIAAYNSENKTRETNPGSFHLYSICYSSYTLVHISPSVISISTISE